MDIERLKRIAEDIQTALLERVAISDLVDFDVCVIPDDNKIDVIMLKNEPLREIKVSLNIMRV